MVRRFKPYEELISNIANLKSLSRYSVIILKDYKAFRKK